MQYLLCVSSLARNPQYPQGVPVSDQSSVDEHFGGSNLAHRVPLLSMDRRKSIQPQTGYEPNLSRRHRNCGSTRTPRVEPGAWAESGDFPVFPKQLLHLLNFTPSICITYSKKYTFILNASKTPTAYTYCLNLPHHLHSPTMDLSITHVLHRGWKIQWMAQKAKKGEQNFTQTLCGHTACTQGEHGCQVDMRVLQGMSSGRVKSGKICAPGMRRRKIGFSSSELDW